MTDLVVTLQCPDRPGIVRALSASIFAIGGNILENDQFTDPTTALFCMRTRFEADATVAQIEQHLAHDLAEFGPTLTLRPDAQHRRAVVMVSQFDHCLVDLLYRRERGDLPLDIVAVVSNHEVCADVAAHHGVPFHYVPVSAQTKTVAEDQVRELMAAHDADLIILARYMQILSPEMCAQFAGRIINIHHSFLPGFTGARPYHRAYDRGVKLIGATAHFVTAELDEGPIIEQDVERGTHARRVEDLVALGRDIERTVLARAARLVAEDRVMIVGRRTVVFRQ